MNNQLFKQVLFNRYLYVTIIEYIKYINRIENALKIQQDVCGYAEKHDLVLRYSESTRKIDHFYQLINMDPTFSKDCRFVGSTIVHKYNWRRNTYMPEKPMLSKLRHPTFATRTYQTAQCVKWLLKNRYGNLLLDKLVKKLPLDFSKVIWPKYATQECLKDFSDAMLNLLIRRAVDYYKENSFTSYSGVVSAIIIFGNKRLIKAALGSAWAPEHMPRKPSNQSLAVNGDVELFKQEENLHKKEQQQLHLNTPPTITEIAMVALKNGNTDLFRYIYTTFKKELVEENYTNTDTSDHWTASLLLCKDLELMKKVWQEESINTVHIKGKPPKRISFPITYRHSYIIAVLSSILMAKDKSSKRSLQNIRHIVPTHKHQLETLRVLFEVHYKKTYKVCEASVQRDLIDNYLVNVDWKADYKETTYTLSDLSLVCAILDICKEELEQLHSHYIAKTLGRVLSLTSDEWICRYLSTLYPPNVLLEGACQSPFPSHILYFYSRLPDIPPKPVEAIPNTIETYNTARSLGIIQTHNLLSIAKHAIKANNLEFIRLVATDNSEFLQQDTIPSLVVYSLETGNINTVKCVLEMFVRSDHLVAFNSVYQSRVYYNPTTVYFIVDNYQHLQGRFEWHSGHTDNLLHYALYFGKMDVLQHLLTKKYSRYRFYFDHCFNVHSTRLLEKREMSTQLEQLYNQQQELIQFACRYLTNDHLGNTTDSRLGRALGSIGDIKLVDMLEAYTSRITPGLPNFHKTLLQTAFANGHLHVIKNMDFKHHVSKIYILDNIKLAIENNHKPIIDYCIKEKKCDIKVINLEITKFKNSLRK
ncbi:hypothetical protein DFA_09255 [Cavenderia fasciculata]|uniref:Ankyrin repeat-containing protein n=1 Tax=Cavenderia fasciculata TaxID=261658 RepID=F4Q743_CACFS|nr:uncharacterized protein DFA_09255 [Cavenderia fasciculata]EGG16225.1 hypothetical protein DFA_09255 [Cavenderia fasciculata]|eukprot:XP_004354609.1 hypothetical protein DFA_09255 [Cavenderia fasciculata]